MLYNSYDVFELDTRESVSARLEAAQAAKDATLNIREIRIEEIRITINIRSPETGDVGDTSDFRSLSFLLYMPLDMPNIDLRVHTQEFFDRVGTHTSIIGGIAEAYVREVTFRTGIAFTLSYALTIVKGIYVAVLWLARGPFDHILVAWKREQERHTNAVAQRVRHAEVLEYFHLRKVIIKTAAE